jgi:hypothetical protein
MMCDLCIMFMGWLLGMSIFIIFAKPIIKGLEKIVGIKPLDKWDK